MIQVAFLILLASTYGQRVAEHSDLEPVISSTYDPAEGKSEQITTILRNTFNDVLSILPDQQSSNKMEQKSFKDSQEEFCVTKSGLVGKCVPYFLCKKFITERIDFNDIRKRRSTMKHCSSYLDTCCAVPGDQSVDKSTPPTSDEGIVTQGCGWHNPNGAGSPNTGEVDKTKFPWTVAVVAVVKLKTIIDGEFNDKTVNVYGGRGSLIHPNVVLTGAHNVAADSSYEYLRVRAGGLNTQNTNELYPFQYRDVKEVVVHEDFTRKNLSYDIALLFLSEPVDMSKPHIGLACLPPQGQRTPAGVRCQASAWRNYRHEEKRVEIPVVDRSVCQSVLRETPRLGADFQIHPTFMCAGGESGEDVCKGDEGSPLDCPIQNEKNRYVQSGIVSWGVKCGDGIPAVYVDVSQFRSWIDDQVANHRYDPKSYTY